MPRPEWQKVREIFDAAVLGRYEIRSELGEGGKSSGEQDWQQIKPSFKDSYACRLAKVREIFDSALRRKPEQRRKFV